MPRASGFCASRRNIPADVRNVEKVAEDLDVAGLQDTLVTGYLRDLPSEFAECQILRHPGPIGLKIRATSTGVPVASANARAALRLRKLDRAVCTDWRAHRGLGHRHPVDDRLAVLGGAAGEHQQRPAPARPAPPASASSPHRGSAFPARLESRLHRRRDGR